MSRTLPSVVESVTFDYWNTIIYEAPGHLMGRRLDAWETILADAGAPVGRNRLGEVLVETWRVHERAWVANEPFHAADAAKVAIDLLGVRVPAGVRDALREGFLRAGEGADLLLTPGIGETVRALEARGVRLAIVCDVGFTPSPLLRDVLDRHGLLDAFDAFAFSDEVGCYKPAPAIFEHALSGCGGIAPERAVHVGDRRRTDVAGALALGMGAVRYRGVYDDPESGPEAQVVADNHEVLLDLVDGVNGGRW